MWAKLGADKNKHFMARVTFKIAVNILFEYLLCILQPIQYFYEFSPLKGQQKTVSKIR